MVAAQAASIATRRLRRWTPARTERERATALEALRLWERLTLLSFKPQNLRRPTNKSRRTPNSSELLLLFKAAFGAASYWVSRVQAVAAAGQLEEVPFRVFVRADRVGGYL